MDTRQRIIEESASLFRTYGIRAITMDMIATSLSISKRTIYELFKDKDELLAGVLQWMRDMQDEMLHSIMDGSDNVVEAIFKIFDLMIAHLKKMSPAFLFDIKTRYKDLKYVDADSEMRFFGFNEEVVKRGIREGIFRDDIDVKISNLCLYEVSKLSSENNTDGNDEFVKSEIVKNLYINYLRGISTQKGLDLINFYEKQRNNS